MFLLTNAFGCVLGEALTPAYDPSILLSYVGPCCTSFITGCLVWALFHYLNAKEEDVNGLGTGYYGPPDMEKR